MSMMVFETDSIYLLSCLLDCLYVRLIKEEVDLVVHIVSECLLSQALLLSLLLCLIFL
jgi:hypothetical protein